MSGRTVLGEFEHHVLLAALRLGRDAYSVALVLELERCTDREVSAAAVFIALRRLEEKGLVRSSTRVEGQLDRRERRYYSVTRAGVSALRAARMRFLRLWDGLEPVLERR
jgi:DNA-binding PadR family transcriptional regulator